MDIKSWGWISLFSLLLISSIGLYWILTSVVCSLTFFLGFCSYIYVKLGNVDEFNSRLLGNPLTTDVSLEGGIQKVKFVIMLYKSTKFFLVFVKIG